jgi:hypothetical protein
MQFAVDLTRKGQSAGHIIHPVRGLIKFPRTS